MSHSELLGVSDGFALFGNDKGLTVVVNLSNLDVFDPVPQVSVEFSRWGDADPTQVPTEAFALASSALGSATRVEGTDVLIASGVVDKRSFAIPRAAQEEASRALAHSKASQGASTAVSRNMARTLANGAPVGIDKVRHIARFFAHSEGASETTLALWGGEAAHKWAANIVKRENDLAVLAGLDFEPDPEAEQPETDEAELTEESTYEPGEPHEYTPDVLQDYACEVCGLDEVAVQHTIIEEEPEAIAASAERPIVSHGDFIPEGIDPDMYISYDVNGDGIPDVVTGIYLRGPDDTWQAWSPQEHVWTEASVPSDVEPIDEDSAYATAILQDSMGQDAIPTNEIDPVEWEIVQAALPELEDELIPEPSMDNVEFSATLDPDAGAVNGVYLHDLSTGCWKWDATNHQWTHLGMAPDEFVEIDAATARDAAARLAKGFTDAGAFDREFSRAAWIGGITELAFDADGQYTPEERSANASRQVRDSRGRFTSAGSIVHVVGNNKTGKVISVDPDTNTALVRFSDGRTQNIPLSQLVRIGEATDGETPYRKLTRDDVERAARSVDISPKAALPYQLPIKTAEDIALMFRDYEEYIRKLRSQEAGLEKYAALDPQTTDVPPLYLAQVDELDKTAVVDLFALVPASKTGTEVILYTRKEGGWVRDDKMLARLRSTSPPPIVTLDAATFKLVVEQVDSYYKEQGPQEEEEPVTAALTLASRVRLWDDDGALMPVFEAAALIAAGVPGIADTPSDIAAARKLKNYWLRGRGAAKIRWNTPGDWTRCTRHLTKYMGPRARGYCQNLHKEATGLYTGDKLHRQLYGRKKFSAPTVVLSSVNDISDDTKFQALLEIDIPTVKDLSYLSTREAGHQLRVGERFLVDGGDGVYAVEVLEPTSTIGWESASAVLVAGEHSVMLLQEA